MPRPISLLLLLIAACSVATFDYTIGHADRQMQAASRDAYRAILDHTAQDPYRYRVLVPWVITPVVSVAPRVMGPDAAFRRVDAVFDLTAFVALLLTLHGYLRTWFREDEALVGTLLVACTMPIALRQHFYAPYSLLEPTLMMVGLVCILTRRWNWLPLLTVTACFNRETGILIPAATVIVGLHETAAAQRRLLQVGLVCGALGVATVLGLRWWIGPAPKVVTIAEAWAVNRSPEGLSAAAVNVFLFLGGGGWLLMFAGAGRAPAFVKRLAWLLVLYLPLYPIFIPAILAAIYTPTLHEPGA